MAFVSYTEDLTCSVCLTIFTDPVMLLCGHAFCRECITVSLKSQDACPLCQTAVSLEEKCLPTSHILKSLAEKAKEDEKRKREHANDREVSEWLCPEHDEKLKLFCVTEQQLTCVICRDGEKHEGHKFKPIKEAAASVRQELEKLMQRVSDDIRTVESLANSQREEITKTEQKSQDLMNQISTQFEEMHQFLRKREEEIKNDLKHKEDDDVKKMTESLCALQTVLSEDEELKRKVTSVLEITESERFLKTCSDEEMMTAEHLFKATSKDLNVVNSSLNLGPFESHLQFFVWKEMLQTIKPREEKLRVASDSKNVTVSDDGKSFFPSPTTSIHQKPSFKKKSLFCSSSFGSTGSNFKPPVLGSISGSAKNTTSSVFICEKDSGQTRSSFVFGPTTSSETKPPPVFDFAFGSTQTTSTSVSGSTTSSETKPPPVFGSAFGSAKTTSTSVSGPTTSSETKPPPVFGSAFGSAKTTSTSVSGPTTSSETKPPPVFGFAFGSTQTTSTSVSGSTTPITTKLPFVSSSISTANAVSINKFTSGQHYWEIEVGERDFWKLGIQNYYLKYDGQQYAICNNYIITEIKFTDRPKKIGFYLNCLSKELSFYDGNNMKHIDTLKCPHMSSPVSAFLGIRYKTPDYNPLTVCWY